MRLRSILFILLTALLVGCGKSKPSQFYVLNPLNQSFKTSRYFNGLQIGIESLTIPVYLNKPQIPLFYTANQASLYESHEWAEDLEKNTKRVLETNLRALLPRSIVESAPWDSKFKPGYRLQIDIAQWAVSSRGKSWLQANYVIFNEQKPLYQKNITFYQQLMTVNPETVVVSMNTNLTRLTKDIADSIRLVNKH